MDVEVVPVECVGVIRGGCERTTSLTAMTPNLSSTLGAAVGQTTVTCGYHCVSWQTGSMSATPLADPCRRCHRHAAREPCVLLKLGEVVLKGGNRQQFERMLQAEHPPGDRVTPAGRCGCGSATA